MHRFFFSNYTWAFWLGGLALGAQAQAPAPQMPPPAGSAATQAPPTLAYTSALEGYRRYSEASMQDWNAANQTVHHIGGWRAYAQEAQPGGGASPQPLAPSSSVKSLPGTTGPVGDGHRGHRP